MVLDSYVLDTTAESLQAVQKSKVLRIIRGIQANWKVYNVLLSHFSMRLIKCKVLAHIVAE